MEFMNVIIAAIAAFVLGAGWYNVLSKQWVEASGVSVDAEGTPVSMKKPQVFGFSFVFTAVVAGMMRHVFASSGVEGITNGLVSGIGIGLFFISPWIAINNLYGARPFKLTLIDGGYATLSCAVIGLVLVLF
ncbi:MAG: DUF1761 domain-containing protein [Rhodobacteraceae bacterium]|nr:DUF1761 domain-containing protein [Paracoccaceae bacterium]